MKKPVWRAVLITAGVLTLSSEAWAQETGLRAENVLARHLESLGPAEQLAAVHNRRAAGPVQLKVTKDRSFEVAAQAFLAFESPRLRIALRFTHPEYRGEDLAFDGKKSNTAQFYPGRRSTLANFLELFDRVLKEGLFGGALSSSWPLLRLKELEPKLDYRGLRKVGDGEYHVLRYGFKKPQAVNIDLCFEAQSFRHVRTVYTTRLEVPQAAVVPGFQVTGPLIGQPTQGSKVTVEEIFSEFQAIDGVTLPTRWVIRVTSTPYTETSYIISSGRNSNSDESLKPLVWELQIKLESVTHNQPTDPSFWVLQQ